MMDKLTIREIAQDHRILGAGVVDLDDTKLLRFYTDDEAWLQVAHTGENLPENIIDVNLFHYYDTLSIAGEAQWEETLRQVGRETYELDGKVFTRAWDGVSTDGSGSIEAVAMTETAYDETDEPGVTDQFVMLFERDIGDDRQELLFVSAEEKAVDDGERFERCLVLSTGIKLTSAQIDIN